MQNVNERKKLKVLILKNKCLKEQKQNSDDNDCVKRLTYAKHR